MEWEQQAQQVQQAAEPAGPSRRRSDGTGRRDSGSGSLSLGSSGSDGSRRASLGLPTGGGGMLYVVRGRTCTVLDGCLEDGPSSCLTICVRSFTGLEVSRAWLAVMCRVHAAQLLAGLLWDRMDCWLQCPAGILCCSTSLAAAPSLTAAALVLHEICCQPGPSV